MVSRLKSNIDEQDTTHAQYRFENCYCAVGVAGLANNLPFIHDNRIEIEGQEIHLWIGIGLFSAIYTLNDQQKKTFPEIADWIEDNVEFK